MLLSCLNTIGSQRPECFVCATGSRPNLVINIPKWTYNCPALQSKPDIVSMSIRSGNIATTVTITYFCAYATGSWPNSVKNNKPYLKIKRFNKSTVSSFYTQPRYHLKTENLFSHIRNRKMIIFGRKDPKVHLTDRLTDRQTDTSNL